MHPFRFRLETLLKFRKMQKEQAQIKYMQAVNKTNLERERLQLAQDRLRHSLQEFKESQQSLVNVEMFKLYQYYFDKIKEDIKNQQVTVQLAVQEQEQALKVLEEALKQVSLVEKFKERRLEQYHLEVLAEEQKQLDEIGLQLYSRA